MGSKKKSQYDPFTSLHPQCLNPSLEPLARDLYALAFKGSEPVWSEMRGKTFKNDPELQKKFLTAAHDGMTKAQKKIIEIVLSGESLSDSHEVLLRGVADGMAWQLIGQQLCYARRFYKEHPPVNLKESNFESVVLCADDMVRQNPGSVSLISDLTSFVQVGDLLTMNSRGGITIGEVKEGQKNHQILEFMNFFTDSGCMHAFQHFANEHGKSGVKQLQRMFRQAGRMGHVTEVMSTGKSLDPDTEQEVRIPEEFVHIETWDKELNEALENSDAKGWAIQVVDDCLFIGVYAKDTMHGYGHLLFNTWFDEFEGGIDSPRFRLNDSMIAPLALPVFNLNISEEHKFDILFGRKNVCIGLNMSALIEKLKESGLTIREATNKEASRIEQKGVRLYRWKGKAIYISNEKNEMLLMDGIFMRTLFHGQRPVKTIQSILANASSEEE